MTQTPAPTPKLDLSVSGLKETARELFSHPPTMFVVLLEAIPALYFMLYGFGAVGGLVMIGTLAMMLFTILAGMGFGFINAPIFATFMGLTCLSAGRPWLAGVVACGLGLWAAFGWGSGKGSLVTPSVSILTIQLLVPTQIISGRHPDDWVNVGAVFGIALAAALWGVVLGGIQRRGRKIPHLPPAGWRWNVTLGALMGLVMGITAGVATAYNTGQGGAWLLMTVFLVFRPLDQNPWTRSLHRVVGTAIGALIVVGFLETIPSQTPTIALMLPAVFFLVAAAQAIMGGKWPYWSFVSLLTPGIVLLVACLSSTSGTVKVAQGLTGVRLEYTLLAIAIALGSQLVLIGMAHLFKLKERAWFQEMVAAHPTPS